MMTRADSGLVTTRSALAKLLPAEATPTALALAELFGDQLNDYAELIVGPGSVPVGFMTRGEDREFTERARTALEELGMSSEALRHHAALAGWFEHLRGFFKLEWSPTAGPLAACYYRRRPSVAETTTRLGSWGVDAQARELIGEVAAVLEKRSVHFVAAAFRPDKPVHHKLYFSQLVAPDTAGQVSERIARVFSLFGFPDELRDAWRERHAATVLPFESTLFVSVSCSADGIVPSFKVDYPSVPAPLAAAWLPEQDRGQVMADAMGATGLAGTRSLSFLGVRFAAERDHPQLKYYCDVPNA